MRGPTSATERTRTYSRLGCVLIALGALACGPTVHVAGPPAEEAAQPPGPQKTPPAPPTPPEAPAPAAGVEPFVKTLDSDEWVSKTLKLQRRYERVLVVGAPAPATIRVGALDLNARGAAAELQEVPVTRAFATLQEAADAARGGDLVAVLPGTYAGFSLDDEPSAGQERFLHFKAMGRPGEVVINRPCAADPRWMIYLRAAHHVVVEGFNIAGSSAPGAQSAQSAGGRGAGIMVDGAFAETGKLAHHIALVGNFSHHHRTWGFHSTDSHSVLLQDNLFAFSAREHGAYASDGSDNYVVRRNVFFGNNAGGFQANLDPEASLEEVLRHPAFRGYPPMEPTRAWAAGLMKLATERFGEHGFPDGRGVNYIIEQNVMNGNGRAGGGAINLAGLSDSLIQNNLVYGNFAHGIAQWDNANPFDRAYVEPGPRSPEQVSGPDALPLWGCRNNLIRNNTVIMSNGGRAALQCGNGSWGCRLRNNILINDASASIEVLNTSIYRFDAGNNVVTQVSYGGMPAALKRLAAALPETRAITGITRARFAAEVVRASEEPWVVLEGSWWKLNPNRPDFRPKPSSKMLLGQGDAREMPARDLLGNKRNGAELGALSPGG
ncbi:right-handed parallel beta-helix repeat-containing protein [Sorangium sp. So ce1036]|uniref:right-handed parallel beta-helix repeat-containing protein n=1 Tax=Sorangium sp. So ce1036 TaxID=3133328 RepID=UPI003F06B575